MENPNQSKSKCSSTSHQLMKDNVKNRLDDLQERFIHLQTARREGRIADVAVLEVQLSESLREWEAELNLPSPASSNLECSFRSSDIDCLLQLWEEEDDATSPLVGPAELKPENDGHDLNPSIMNMLPEDYLANSEAEELGFQGFNPCNGAGFYEEFDQGLLLGPDGAEQFGNHAGPDIFPKVSPPPSAFMGPKCALWDCTRPAQGSEPYEDYCSGFHATLALKEDPPGTTPILRPGGISLKDNLLVDALVAKTQGKNVGIPECDGAATEKSPWNATALFDQSLLEGETVREWLFFDKPRRAFESGNRKQRSLPDYAGRGWHESRKLVVKESGKQALRRSYYMDPQPPGDFEWHLFEYEITGCNTFALYRLELKHVNEKKKSPKGKSAKDPVADLQKKMGRLTAEVPGDDSPLGES